MSASVGWAIVTHGGAATPRQYAAGCERAAAAARLVLVAGGDAVAAALEATRLLEDEPRYNAGTGSNLRLDGSTVQMDAAVMASDGRFGGVACIERVQNPVLVAARVMETPHLVLVGEGATAFARRLGFPDYDPVTEAARAKHARAMQELAGAGDGYFADDALPWRGGAASRYWNFDGEPSLLAQLSAAVASEVPRGELSRNPPGRNGGCDTVGAVVRDSSGGFCATASTGGTVYMLRGRVGDSPIIGCGLYAGPHGAVAATGIGEEIARRVLAKAIYDWLAEGMSPSAAGARAVSMFDTTIDVGLLIASRGECVVAGNREFATCTLLG